MSLSFYTTDDLRLGPNLWTETRFDSVQEALAHYRSLPPNAAKELGLMDGARKLSLIRRAAMFPNETPGEDALVTGRLTQPPWRGALEVLTAARKCVSALKIRYCLDRGRLVPKPTALPEELRQSGFGPPVVRRAYIATAGWLTPAELKRRFPEERGASSCPLVLKYLADVHLDDGPRTMELTHWDLRRLESRAGTFAASK